MDKITPAIALPLYGLLVAIAIIPNTAPIIDGMIPTTTIVNNNPTIPKIIATVLITLDVFKG